MSIFISHYQGRTAQYTVTINDADGNAVVFASGDVFRVKIGRGGDTPKLDLSSNAAASGGSSLTAANPSTMIIAQDDADWTPGAYDLEASIVDATDSKIKHADTGVLVVHESPGGEVGL